ncbi:helicase HerA domain-containing protein [Salinisphaera dokdonensis]|uniref:helicase HerA domain-containing protein n=1 Tax=Salinisphaera dokdonensis TaxID=454598 RepID=UPI00333E98E5
MQDYEKLGAFYLGREHDLASEQTGTAPLLYDAKDLTTHAVIIGMTGSGKTGLGVGLIEEAAIDGVPVIAIDPKGDLGNLLLTFPDLTAADFEPWVDPAAATTQGNTVAAHAKAQAELWRKGLASWDQDGARIRRLKEAAEFGIFTPGSTAGIPISVLSSFDAPSAALRDDAEAFAERIQATAISILTLLGIDADPLSSREYILISNILQHAWQAGRSLDLPGLIGAIQSPPVQRIGVMDLEAMYPAKERFALAMQLNNVLASPGFASWMQGQALSARSLFYTDAGRPRVSILSIAHLTDAERMFFVTMLLGEIIAWMRAQPGTSSLRAVLYMDELFGYMPPTANPPSKMLFLTLLKQARAYGLGLVLSTQNPVDLDYKGLSNTGTWFIGRLQTERDKNRVLDGLEGAGAGGGPFDRGAMEQTLAGLGKRVFLLHNVHETEPVVFHTRWALSYLPGPLTRDQIRRLTQATPHSAPAESVPAPGKAPRAPRAPVEAATAAMERPVLDPGIHQYFLPVTMPGEGPLTYYAQIVGAAEVFFTSRTHGIDLQRAFVFGAEPVDGSVALDWDWAEALAVDITALEDQAPADATFGPLAPAARRATNFREWERDYKTWLRKVQALTLFRSKTFKQVSAPDESEADFRIRLQQLARERRDLEVGKLRARYEKSAGRLRERLRSAERKIEEQKAQASQKKIESALSIGGALLGAFLGRKRLSSSTVSRVGTAARRAGYAAKEIRDVREAEADAAELQAKLDAEGEAFAADVARLEGEIDAQTEVLDTVQVRARSSDIDIRFVALLWSPYRRSADGRTRPA